MLKQWSAGPSTHRGAGRPARKMQIVVVQHSRGNALWRRVSRLLWRALRTARCMVQVNLVTRLPKHTRSCRENERLLRFVPHLCVVACAGIYFAKDASMSHAYAVRTAQISHIGLVSHRSEPRTYTCRMFMSRIVTGVYTAGSSDMRQPPIDAAGAKGEHYHSLVGQSPPMCTHPPSTTTPQSLTLSYLFLSGICPPLLSLTKTSRADHVTHPRIFVVNDNTRAYPAYLITYQVAQDARPELFSVARQSKLQTARRPLRPTPPSLPIPAPFGGSRAHPGVYVPKGGIGQEEISV
jgi:hypothetical protein